MTTTLTLISLTITDPDSFEQLSLEERRSYGGSWTYPVGSGRPLDTFLMKATKSDLGVFAFDKASDGSETCMIDQSTLVDDIAPLERLVETKRIETARALHEHGKKAGSLTQIEAALQSGTWPTNGDAAEEAAAFAHHLLRCARFGMENHMGVCWEVRGAGMN